MDRKLVITLSFAPATSDDEREQALKTISTWTGIACAEFLKANSKNAIVRRMAFIRLQSPELLDEVKAHLEKLQLFQSISTPAARYLGPFKADKVRGQIELTVLAGGSKHERPGYTLNTKNNQSYALEIEGMGPYTYEPFSHFNNRVCIVKGKITGASLLVQSITTIAAPKQSLALVYGPPCSFLPEGNAQPNERQLRPLWCQLSITTLHKKLHKG